MDTIVVLFLAVSAISQLYVAATLRRQTEALDRLTAVVDRLFPRTGPGPQRPPR